MTPAPATLKFHPVSGLFPLLEGGDFDALVADIRTNGLHEPIRIHQDGSIIDGRNRYRACREAGVDVRAQTYIGSDEGLLDFTMSQNLHRRHLDESQRAMVGAELANIERGGAPHGAQEGQICTSKAADMVKVSERLIKTARKVRSNGIPDLITAVERGDVAVSDAESIVDLPEEDQHRLLDAVRKGSANNLKAARRKDEIKAQRQAIESGEAVMPEGVFEVIVIDPPWPYDGRYDPNHFMGRAANPYPEMSLDDIAALELPAADDCILWLWTTHKFMFEAGKLLDTWGFEHKAILTWVKDRMGIGRWLRSQSEFCIMAVRGKPTINLMNQTTVLHAPMRQHSRKPDEFYKMVESLCIGRRLDFFSREKRKGWEQAGNDVDKFQDQPFPEYQPPEKILGEKPDLRQRGAA